MLGGGAGKNRAFVLAKSMVGRWNSSFGGGIYG